MMRKKTIQYVLAHLTRNKIFSYAIAADDGHLTSVEFYERIEQSLNFKIE